MVEVLITPATRRVSLLTTCVTGCKSKVKTRAAEGWPNAIWKTDVACKLAEIAAFADYIAALMKEAEWLYSGDTGEDTFIERMKQIEATRGWLELKRGHNDS